MNEFTPPPREEIEKTNKLDLAEELSTLGRLQKEVADARSSHGPGSPEEAKFQGQIEAISPIVREISSLEHARDGYFAEIKAIQSLHGLGSSEEASLRRGIDHVETRLATLLEQCYED